MSFYAILIIYALLAGCTTITASNEVLSENEKIQYHGRATFNIAEDRGRDDVLMILSLSGGGSRAAYFAGLVMLKLQKVYPDIDLLKEVDAISSVSGGTLPAAYYTISRDPDEIVSARIRGGINIDLLTEDLKTRVIFNKDNKLLGFKEIMSKEEIKKVKEALDKECPEIREYDEKIVDRLQVLCEKGKVISGRVWNRKHVKRLMSENYLLKWIINGILPESIIRIFFTEYTRSDIMAQTFADNMYDTKSNGLDLKFKDLNPERPYLIINSTDATSGDYTRTTGPYKSTFTFTHEDFSEIGSNIQRYEIARAVMASAAFPGVFNYVTLKNYNITGKPKSHHVHVFDGGTYDNLGLSSVRRIINEYIKNRKKPTAIIVILVDAYTQPKGIDTEKRDPRTSPLDYVVDSNFLDAFDSLLQVNREEKLSKSFGHNVYFWHIKFDAIKCEKNNKQCYEDLNALNKIPTNFYITDSNQKLLEKAVNMLMAKDNPDLLNIKTILLQPYGTKESCECRDAIQRAETAASELADSLRRLRNCGEAVHYSVDCSKELLKVKNTQNDYEDAMSSVDKYCPAGTIATLNPAH
jgi:NTE family protein